jgi:hypothetical protein
MAKKVTNETECKSLSKSLNGNAKQNPKERFTDFGHAKFSEGGSVLGSSQFSLLPQLPLKSMLGLKVVKINSKIRNSLR